MSLSKLEDYGLIGFGGRAALADRFGAIDWCCLPSIDSPSHFGAGPNADSRFQIRPQGEFHSEQRYLQRTLVLETAFETPFGRAILTDWMPSSKFPQLLRRIEVTQGAIQFLLQCSPCFDNQSPSEEGLPEFQDGDIIFRNRKNAQSEPPIARLSASIPLRISEPRKVRMAFTLQAGQSAVFRWSWGFSRPSPHGILNSLDARPTAQDWQSWAHHCDPASCPFVGPWHDTVIRSSLLIRMLTQTETGAIASSVASTRKEASDSRSASLRTGAWAIPALSSLGDFDAVKNWFRWLCDLLERDGAEGLQTVYGLDGARREGHPFQLSLYGHALLAAWEYFQCFGHLPEGAWPKFANLADLASQAWRRPDYGYWGIDLMGAPLAKPEHFVSSKLFAWVALDRAIRLAKAQGVQAPPRWATERETLHRTICQQGFDPTVGTSGGSFVRSFGDHSLDSASLLIPLLGFLPIDDFRITGTLETLQTDLSSGILLRRHTSYSYDGKNGSEEPCHLLSSLWLTRCLMLAGQVNEAGDRLAEICSYASASGIFGEYVNPETGETMGNFPDASVHLELINAALALGLARGRRKPTKPFTGPKDVPCESRGDERKQAS